MSMLKHDDDEGQEIDPHTGGILVRRNAAMVLRCANPKCNHLVGRASLSPGNYFDVTECPKCHRASRFRQESDGSGMSIILLPTQKG